MLPRWTGDRSRFCDRGVVKPGRYTALPGDPVLSLLDKAGGIDPVRGSYRSIRLLRGGAAVSDLDLYPFARGASCLPYACGRRYPGGRQQGAEHHGHGRGAQCGAL